MRFGFRKTDPQNRGVWVLLTAIALATTLFSLVRADRTADAGATFGSPGGVCQPECKLACNNGTEDDQSQDYAARVINCAFASFPDPGYPCANLPQGPEFESCILSVCPDLSTLLAPNPECAFCLGQECASGTTADLVINCASGYVPSFASNCGLPSDGDGDGVPDAVEDACPSLNSSLPPGDGDGDGTADKDEPNVTSLPTATGRGCVTLVSSCSQNFGVTALSEAGLGNDPHYDYPFGLLEYTVCNGPNCFGAPCLSSSEKLIYHDAGDLETFVYRKYGPMGTNSTATFYTLPSTPPQDTQFSGNMVTYTLVDGQLGDATDISGRIQDPGGPATMIGSAAPVVTLTGLVAVVIGLLFIAAVSLRRRGASDSSST